MASERTRSWMFRIDDAKRLIMAIASEVWFESEPWSDGYVRITVVARERQCERITWLIDSLHIEDSRNSLSGD